MAVMVATVVLVCATACDGSPPEVSQGSGASEETTSTGPSEGTAPVGGPPDSVKATDYDPAFFDETSVIIDNPWFPMPPGTQFVYRGSTVEGNKRVRHRTRFTVTDLTKVVDGVRTVIVWDRDYSGGELVETELAMFAQDTAGNIWHFGQYPEEYENGRFVRAPAWVAGYEGAKTGLTIKADPQLESPAYSQGYAPPPINWIDRARVYQMGQQTCVPFGCYENVLVTEEFELDKPGAFQLKFYASGVGNVRVGWRGRNEDEQETLVLVDVIQLDAAALAKIRAGALELDSNGYRRAEGSWGNTPPAERIES
jgi:hypothetical protein